MKKISILLFLNLYLLSSLWSAKKTHPWMQNRFVDRIEFVEEYGGTEETVKAVELSLKYLAKNQKKDGSWTSGDSSRDYRVAITSMVIMAYYANGYTEKKGKYKKTLSKAINYLLKRIAKSKSKPHFGNNYGSAMALMALSESVLLGNKNRNIVKTANTLVDYFIGNFNGRGWRYTKDADKHDDGQDVSVSGWVVMSLALAQQAKLRSTAKLKKEGIYDGYSSYIKSMKSENGDLIGYDREGGNGHFVMTAIGLFTHKLLEKRFDPILIRNGMGKIKGGIDKNIGLVRSFEGKDIANPYELYWATLWNFQYQGEVWDLWNKKMKKALLFNQIDEDSIDEKKAHIGSWFSGKRSKIQDRGGRILTTAFNVLNLSVYYRYPIFGKE